MLLALSHHTPKLFLTCHSGLVFPTSLEFFLYIYFWTSHKFLAPQKVWWKKSWAARLLLTKYSMLLVLRPTHFWICQVLYKFFYLLFRYLETNSVMDLKIFAKHSYTSTQTRMATFRKKSFKKSFNIFITILKKMNYKTYWPGK